MLTCQADTHYLHMEPESSLSKQMDRPNLKKTHMQNCYSRKLTNPQTRYTVTELELLAIVETLREYKCILLGHLITIYTDHKNLTF
jgi:hypothetical protein